MMIQRPVFTHSVVAIPLFLITVESNRHLNLQLA